MSQPATYSCIRFHGKDGQTLPIDDIVFQNDIKPFYAAIENASVGASIDMILEYSEGNVNDVAKCFPSPVNTAAKISLMLESSNGRYDRIALIEVSHLPGYKLALKVTKLNS